MAANAHTVYMLGALLGVHCKDCKHRAVLTADAKTTKGKPVFDREDMTPVRAMRLRCSACKSEEVERVVIKDADDGRRFMAGHTVQSIVPV